MSLDYALLEAQIVTLDMVIDTGTLKDEIYEHLMGLRNMAEYLYINGEDANLNEVDPSDDRKGLDVINDHDNPPDGSTMVEEDDWMLVEVEISELRATISVLQADPEQRHDIARIGTLESLADRLEAAVKEHINTV